MSSFKKSPAWYGRKAPACFATGAQWSEWKDSARTSKFRGDHCTDCTSEYQQQMLAANRCERPDTLFALDEDGFISGIHPTPHQATQPHEETP